VPCRCNRSPEKGENCRLTCQSTRTHNSRLRLRRSCWWSGHFYYKGFPICQAIAGLDEIAQRFIKEQHGPSPQSLPCAVRFEPKVRTGETTTGH
jgi:hypothetical protein